MEAKIGNRADDSTVLVGKKPPISYVLACMTQFNSGKSEIKVKARGLSITTAVDVAQILKNKYLSEVKVKNVSIGTETVSRDNGKMNVSTIEITLSK